MTTNTEPRKGFCKCGCGTPAEGNWARGHATRALTSAEQTRRRDIRTAREQKEKSMRGEKTQARIAVETALQQHSSLTKPLRAERISELSGVDLSLVRYYLGRFMGSGTVFNMGKRSSSAYVWSAATPREIPESVPRFSADTYCGPKWNIRTGGEDHLAHMSRRGDEFVPPQAPFLMGQSLA